MNKTTIEWADATWNPIAARFSDPGQPYEGLARRTESGPRWTGKVITVPGHLEDPIHWKEPRMIFVNSMADMFHENLPFEELLPMIDVMDRASWHVYQILTKRAMRMREFFNNFLQRRAPHNWWLGVSAEDQPTANARIPALLNTWATVRWVSLEPLLGPIDMVERGDPEFGISFSWLDGFDGCEPPIPPLDWVVVGGESGPGARPMNPKWAKQLRDQCQAFPTHFFFKQWGEWVPAEQSALTVGEVMKAGRDTAQARLFTFDKTTIMIRVGKKAAGRLLDGREWNEYPSTRDFVTPVLEALRRCN